MHSLTRHEPRTCLAETDMAGLHALYPTCNELIPTEISCVKATRLSGWLRLASVVGQFPIAFRAHYAARFARQSTSTYLF